PEPRRGRSRHRAPETGTHPVGKDPQTGGQEGEGRLEDHTARRKRPQGSEARSLRARHASVTCVRINSCVSSETGKFSTDIGEDVIAAALESVEKQRESSPAEEPVPIEDGAPDELAALKARIDALEARERELSAQVDQERERTLRAMADLDNA